MSASFDFEAPDHFTTGTVGPSGQRVFYLQAREARRIVTLKVEKEQIRALAEYLSGFLARLKGGAEAIPEDLALLEPVEAAWDVGSIGVGYDEEPPAARFRVTRAQAAGFVERAQELMRGSRPACPLCTQPMDPAGHVCPRKNGHVAHNA